MKKAYNEIWVKNLAVQDMAHQWLKNNLLSTAQYEQVLTAFPESFYRPGKFVKIGLFLFTLFGSSFFAGFLSLFFIENAGGKTFAVLSLISAVCYYFFLEYFIRNRKLFHSGIDNALLYMANAAVIFSFVILFENLDLWQYCLFVLLINATTSLRYADLFTVFISLIAVFVCSASILIKMPIGKAMLPFAMMILSAGIYLLNKKERSFYYHDCQKLIKAFMLITLYLSGNYYVVREGNAMLSGLASFNTPQIPLAFLFYLLTAGIPLFYCFWGLKQKDRIFLTVGLAAAAFSCFTYRYYADGVPIEIFLCITGAALFLIGYLAIHYLKTPRFGLTDEVSEKNHLGNLEATLIAHQFGQAPEEDQFNFDGGNFGGGGAGNDY